MALLELQAQDLRCLEQVSLAFTPGLNLISGPNGAGKTSLLEAAFVLGRGRSFRTRHSERLVRIGRPRFVVFGRVSTVDGRVQGIGVSVDREGLIQARRDGRDVDTLAELSLSFPVQVIDPEIHRLIEDGPPHRRRWLDWMVFHVEPGFASVWSRYQRALRQRNAALKAGPNGAEVWEPELASTGETLTAARQRAIDRLRPFWEAVSVELLGFGISLGFSPGWDRQLALREALEAHRARDAERGSTQVGPHRADLSLRVDGRAARDVLSRGQQKLAAIALTLGQLQALRADQALRPTLLLDDPAAELDTEKLGFVIALVRGLGTQLIVTCLSPEFSALGPPDARFHVEHGRVKQV